MWPKFPVYIVSKWRAEYMITSKVLTEMWVDHFIIVEKQDLLPYQKAIEKWNLKATLIELDITYKEKYETCDDLGLTKSTWPWPARNFTWDDSIKKGFDYHWVMDDNIKDFRVIHKTERIKTNNPDFWAYMEDYICSYENIVMWWPNYTFFAVPHKTLNPFVANTRIYSCNFIRNNIKFRWRGRYNEDTILSLDILNSWLCTIQFNMFLQWKMGTQILKWWNTDEFYLAEWKRKDWERYADTWTLAKSEMLAKIFPKYCMVKYVYWRIHHYCNYNWFKKQKFIKKKDFKHREKTPIIFIKK